MAQSAGMKKTAEALAARAAQSLCSVVLLSQLILGSADTSAAAQSPLIKF